jgi:hypothetical protein
MTQTHMAESVCRKCGGRGNYVTFSAHSVVFSLCEICISAVAAEWFLAQEPSPETRGTIAAARKLAVGRWPREP